MQVIGLEEYGGPEVLKPFEIPTPHAGEGEIRVQVKATTVNPADVMLRTGYRNCIKVTTRPLSPVWTLPGWLTKSARVSRHGKWVRKL